MTGGYSTAHSPVGLVLVALGVLGGLGAVVLALGALAGAVWRVVMP